MSESIVDSDIIKTSMGNSKLWCFTYLSLRMCKLLRMRGLLKKASSTLLSSLSLMAQTIVVLVLGFDIDEALISSVGLISVTSEDVPFWFSGRLPIASAEGFLLSSKILALFSWVSICVAWAWTSFSSRPWILVAEVNCWSGKRVPKSPAFSYSFCLASYYRSKAMKGRAYKFLDENGLTLYIELWPKAEDLHRAHMLGAGCQLLVFDLKLHVGGNS